MDNDVSNEIEHIYNVTEVSTSGGDSVTNSILHSRYGHTSKLYPLSNCKPCLLGKMKRKSIGTMSDKNLAAKRPLERLVADISGHVSTVEDGTRQRIATVGGQ